MVFFIQHWTARFFNKMGIILSKIWFNGGLSTKDQLEKLTRELDDIHDSRVSTRLQYKQVVGTLIVISIIAYIIAFFVFFFFSWPSSLVWKIVGSSLFLVFPAVIWLMKKGLHWYFNHRLSQNEDKVTLLLRKRKKLLDDVKEKETYKVAKELLEKYDPEQVNSKAAYSMLTTPSGSLDNLSKLPEMELRRRASFGSKRLPSQLPKAGSLLNTTQVVRPSAVIKPGYNAPPGTIPRVLPSQVQVRPAGIPMPCPILPRQRGGFDRLVEYVLADGPSNRYALICRQCQSHNGMALKEEFEYISYRCCYCYYYNPARKVKPLPPRLSLSSSKITDDRIKEDVSTDDSQKNDKVTESKKELEDKEIALGTSYTDDVQVSTTEDVLGSTSETESIVEEPCVVSDLNAVDQQLSTLDCLSSDEKHLEAVEKCPESALNDNLSHIEGPEEKQVIASE